MLELYRRVLLALALFVGCWLYFLADLGTFYELRLPKEEKAGQHAVRSLLSEPGKAAGPDELPLPGPEWEGFLTKARSVSMGQDNDPRWLARVPSYARGRDRGRPVFFRASEAPLCALQGQFESRQPAGGRLLLRAADQPGTVLEWSASVIANDSFHLGVGLSDYGPPKAMVMRHRHQALLIWALGALIYLVLPWPRFAAGELRYSRWRICLADVLWLLLSGVFFVLPLAIVGGSVQAFRVHGMFPALLWSLAGLGLVLLWQSAESAAWSLRVSEKGLAVRGLFDRIDLGFERIVRVSPCAFRAPRWLVRMLWVAALFGRGTSGLQAAGQARILEHSRHGGLALELADGSRVYLWLTDALGNQAAHGAENLLDILIKAGVRQGAPLELARLLPPALYEPAARSCVWRHLAFGVVIFLGPALAVCLVRL